MGGQAQPGFEQPRAQFNDSPAFAPRADVKAKSGFPKGPIFAGLGALILLGIGIFAFLNLRGDDFETVGPGSLDEPYERDSAIRVADRESDDGQKWLIDVVNPVETEGDLAVATVNVINEAGSDDGASLEDLSFDAVSSSGEVYSSKDCESGGIDANATLQVSDNVEGNICWEVPADEMSGLMLGVSIEDVKGRVHILMG